MYDAQYYESPVRSVLHQEGHQQCHILKGQFSLTVVLVLPKLTMPLTI